MNQLCCLVKTHVHCTLCNTRWCFICWTEAEGKSHWNADMTLARCSTTDKRIRVRHGAPPYEFIEGYA